MLVQEEIIGFEVRAKSFRAFKLSLFSFPHHQQVASTTSENTENGDAIFSLERNFPRKEFSICFLQLFLSNHYRMKVETEVQMVKFVEGGRVKTFVPYGNVTPHLFSSIIYQTFAFHTHQFTVVLTILIPCLFCNQFLIFNFVFHPNFHLLKFSTFLLSFGDKTENLKNCF